MMDCTCAFVIDDLDTLEYFTKLKQIEILENIQKELHKLAFDNDGEYMGVIDNDDAMDLIDKYISELKGGAE